MLACAGLTSCVGCSRSIGQAASLEWAGCDGLANAAEHDYPSLHASYPCALWVVAQVNVPVGRMIAEAGGVFEPSVALTSDGRFSVWRATRRAAAGPAVAPSALGKRKAR